MLNLLGAQKKIKIVPEVLNKMLVLGIQPDEKSYNYLIKAAAEVDDYQLAEQYFKEAITSIYHHKKEFLPNKYFYTTLMKAYINTNNSMMAYKILQEMVEKGIKADLPSYTTLINCFRIDRQLQKCWELNKQVVKTGIPLDETYIGVMLKVHAAVRHCLYRLTMQKWQ